MINSRYKFDTVTEFGHTHDLLKHALNLVREDGTYIELGVYQGTTINFIANNINQTIYGFDSFEGLPEHWNFENPKGQFNLDGNMPQVKSNVVLFKGWFNETLPRFVNEQLNSKIVFVHFDADLYSSTKCGFDNFKPHLAKECIFVFNEFCYYPGWEEGEFRAFNEFLDSAEHELIPLGKVGHNYCNYACKVIFK